MARVSKRKATAKSDRKSNPDSKKRPAPRLLMGTCQGSSHTFNGMSVAEASRQGLAGFLPFKLEKGFSAGNGQFIPPDSSFEHKSVKSFQQTFRMVENELVPAQHRKRTKTDDAPPPGTLQDNFQSPHSLLQDDFSTPSTTVHDQFNSTPDMFMPAQFELPLMFEHPPPVAPQENPQQLDTFVQVHHQTPGTFMQTPYQAPMSFGNGHFSPPSMSEQQPWVPFVNMNEVQQYPGNIAPVHLNNHFTTCGSGHNGAGGGYGAVEANPRIFSIDGQFGQFGTNDINQEYTDNGYIGYL